MVEGDHRRDQAFEFGDSPAEALVVVDDVELPNSVLQVMVHPGAEGERFRKHTGGEHGHFEQIMTGLELPEGWEPAGVVVVEQVEAREFGEGDAVVEHRIRLAAEDLDLVSEVDEGFGEVTGVDALPADVGLTPVGQVGDPKRGIRIGGR